MSEAYFFEGHIEGDRIVPDVPLNLPDRSQVRVQLQVVDGKQSRPVIRPGKQNLAAIAGKRKVSGVLQVGTLSREEIYRTDC